jgi:hypothetical protein
MQTAHDNIVSLSSSLPAWLESGHAGFLRRIAAQVKARCGTDGYIDTMRREVCFAYHNGGDVRIAFSWPLKPHWQQSGGWNRFESTNGTDVSVDDICYAINLGKVDPERKKLWETERKRSALSAERERSDRVAREGLEAAAKSIERAGRKVVSA